jgi:hypothetical protein
MIFKHFCAVFFSPTDDLNIEVDKISEGKVRLMSGKNISIFTFSTILDTNSLTDYFKSFDRNFLLFDLDEQVSGFNFVDKEKEDDLFGFLKTDKNNKTLESLSNSLLDDFINHSSDIINTPMDLVENIKPNFEKSPNSFNLLKMGDYNYENMSSKEINDEIDKIIDKGVKNLTETDKKVLEKLSNLI